ncbi:MAG: NUDIX hydrolase [Novosphingobium sp. 16-62-11]|uniref:NUDIX hydrolase n=1 Tax=Novosphingobium sp. 17-62-19 TaxID=1970406 RepID=UPI000BD6428C|nr:NUDIX hydrolase [Novosphingobium sp. 17-62-19]OYX96558.1 MAG: NUDIX hydrolase [Novosphingobium sp. 35-62-5]OYZ40618.1 MAG: NUDIX hydrolase [Novosphingobium sp. 16-62-11]OZA62630.1 MAG: NUDIX hydrolase [Sphingomonadales bacterium 39-62-4]HQS96119.1 NUDIX hydrolase [Novosphingobium sp.]OZA18204.1 MAG: NUDIX hydrolase [Novosphingobium sp. 17-62-19]
MSLEEEYRDHPEQVRWEGRFIAAKTRGRWEYVSRTRNIKAAVILAIDDGHVLLVEQFRVPLGRPCIELPAGLIGDEAGSENEDAAAAAARELEEETGYRPGRIESLGEFHSSPGMVTEAFTLFRAHDLEKISEGGGVEGEGITVHRVALTEIERFLSAKRAEGYAIDVRMLLLLSPGILG